MKLVEERYQKCRLEVSRYPKDMEPKTKDKWGEAREGTKPEKYRQADGSRRDIDYREGGKERQRKERREGKRKRKRERERERERESEREKRKRK